MARSQLHRWLIAAVLVTGAGVPFAAGHAAPAEAAPPAADAIPFDHTIHAGKYAMPCLACHVNARNSTTAGLPSVRK